MTEEYYLQNKDAGYLGNAPTWWAKGGKGYTAYILGAERFTREGAQKYVTQDPEKFAMYKCSDIDARLHMVFDSQDFENLGTDAPCGWASGYAPALKHTTDKLDIHIVLDTLADAARGRTLDPETCQVIESIARDYDHKDFTADDVEALYRCGWQPPRPQGVKEAVDYFSERYQAELDSGDLCPHEFEKNLSIVIAAARTGHDLPEKLPCDVTIGAGIFRRGVPTRLVLEKIKWWQDMVAKGETPPENRRPPLDCTCTVKERYSGHRIDCDVPQREGGE